MVTQLVKELFCFHALLPTQTEERVGLGMRLVRSHFRSSITRPTNSLTDNTCGDVLSWPRLVLTLNFIAVFCNQQYIASTKDLTVAPSNTVKIFSLTIQISLSRFTPIAAIHDSCVCKPSYTSQQLDKEG